MWYPKEHFMITSINMLNFGVLSSVFYSQMMSVVSFIVVMVWLGMMCTKVLAASTNSVKAQRAALYLNVGILPLGIVCSMIFLFKIIAILS